MTARFSAETVLIHLKKPSEIVREDYERNVQIQTGHARIRYMTITLLARAHDRFPFPLFRKFQHTYRFSLLLSPLQCDTNSALDANTSLKNS